MDVSSGKVLYAMNEHERLYPASVTKIMAMLLFAEAIDSGRMTFEEKELDRIGPYMDLVHSCLDFVNENINKPLSAEKLAQAEVIEDQIDTYRKQLKKIARKNLEKGSDVRTELLYLDLIRHIEKIGDHAFNHVMFSDIDLSGCILTGKNIFYECYDLETTNFTNLITINNTVFFNCTSLKEIQLDHISVINLKVFHRCFGLEKIILPEPKRPSQVK